MKEKRKTFNALLAIAGFYEHKLDILSVYGVTSTMDLTEEELDELIERFREIVIKQNNITEAEVRRLRSRVLTILQRVGIYKNDKDWARVNKFMLNPKVAGKLLYEMDENELKAFLPKLHKIAKWIQKKQDEENVLARLN